MPKRILDTFTSMRLTRHQKVRLRRLARGGCYDCGKPAVWGSDYCLDHLRWNRERMRRKLCCTRRNRHARSYWIEAQAEARKILAEP